jgi:hypothetical protein
VFRRSTFLLVLVVLVAMGFLIARRASNAELVAASSIGDGEADEPANAMPQLALDFDLGSDAAARRAAEPTGADANARSATRIATLIGHVVGRDGRGIIGAKLRRGTDEELAQALADPSAVIASSDAVAGTSTDYEGGFAFTGVSTTEATLIVGPWRDGHVAERGWTLVQPGERPVLTMLKCARARLFAEGYNASTDEPIARLHVAVRIRDPRVPAITEVEGWNGKLEQELEFPPGAEVELSFSVPSMGVANTPELTRIVQPADGDQMRLRIPIDFDRAVAPWDMRVMTGTVLDARTRAPIRDATLQLICSPAGASPDGSARGIERELSTSDARGRFRIATSAVGDCTLTARASGYTIERMVVGADQPIEFLLDPAARLAIRVEGRDGAEFPRVLVKLSSPQTSPGEAPRTQSRLTDAAGATEPTEVEPGNWTVTFMNTRSSRAESYTIPVPIEVELGRDLELRFVLDPAAWTGTWELRALRE